MVSSTKRKKLIKTSFRWIIPSSYLLTGLVLTQFSAQCQVQKPGLTGMSPSKWVKISNTQAPGRIYGTQGGSKLYTQEDFYFKMWLPIIQKANISLIVGPNYRIEQFEFKDVGENHLEQMSNWKLQTLGLDLTSLVTLKHYSWIIARLNVKQSASIDHDQIPIDYTISTVYIKKKSDTREVGVGITTNHSVGRTVAFPMILFNHNFSTKTGVEILLPYKISWRYNLTPTDIFYLQGEAMSRSYYLTGSTKDYSFRRTEFDMGLVYNRRINSLLGIELFTGYRHNLNTRLPNEITPVKTSGVLFSVELYIKSPFNK